VLGLRDPALPQPDTRGTRPPPPSPPRGSKESGRDTATVSLVIAIIGVPAVIAYTAIVYWSFRGRVRLDDRAY